MFQNIQILRAVAAVMVVIFHVVLWLPRDAASESMLFRLFSEWGKSGVDLFFVISGFVIMLSQARQPRPFGAFMRNRVLRIVPLYWLVTALFLLLAALRQIVHAEAMPQPGHAALSLAMISWLVAVEMPVVFVGWTLEYEMLFYLLFAGVCLRVPLRHVVWVLGGVLAMAVWLGLVEQIVLEFVLGMLIAQARLLFYRIPAPWLLFAAGCALFMLPAFQSVTGPRLLHLGLPAAMIVAGLAFMSQWRSRVGSYLGAASYSIYLGQALAIPIMQRVVLAILPDVPFDLQAGLITLLVVLAGCALYSLIERPLSVWLKGPARQAATVGRVQR